MDSELECLNYAKTCLDQVLRSIGEMHCTCDISYQVRNLKDPDCVKCTYGSFFIEEKDVAYLESLQRHVEKVLKENKDD